MSRHVTDLARHLRRSRAPLAVYLAAAYTLLIVHASLSPFTGWRPAAGGVFAFLGTWPRYLTAFDIAVNVAAYVPFGLLAGYALAKRVRQPDLLLAVAALGGALSLGMEALQALLPGRIASVADLLANAAGAALGGAVAPWLGHPRFRTRAYALRDALFLQGRIVDWGLALLALWLLAQTNPALPLLATWAPEPHLHPAPPPFSFAEMSSVLLNAFATGALIAALLQPARRAWLWLLAFAAAVCAVKWLAAQWLLKPAAALDWASREALVGSGYGLLLAALAGLARLRAQLLVAGIALAAGIILSWAAQPHLASPVMALAAFSWRGGHLLTFTGLTQAVAGIWPWLVLIYLLLLGRRVGVPRRGEA